MSIREHVLYGLPNDVTSNPPSAGLLGMVLRSEEQDRLHEETEAGSNIKTRYSGVLLQYCFGITCIHVFFHLVIPCVLHIVPDETESAKHRHPRRFQLQATSRIVSFDPLTLVSKV